MKPRIGFIGLGLMGAPMCKRFLKAGYKVTVWGRHAKRCAPLVKAGAKQAATPAELAVASDVVITIVTAPRDVGEVLFAKNGVVDGAHDGLTVIDMSTIGRQAARGISDGLADYGIEFMDAPVTGSVPSAEAGTLVIIAGGSKKMFKRCEKILKVMGMPHLMGDTGSGQLVKTMQNMIGASELCALGEALALCESYGVPRKRAGDLLSLTGVASPLIKMKIPSMVKEKYPTLFSLANMLKDLKLGQLEARRAGLKLRVGRAAETSYVLANDMGLSHQDFAAVAKVSQRKKR
ncbi:MAG: 6-phosphogluconate dehydrogenase [Deltaproteobacteria bacterium CG11_big_fil_rev_8_21_14_0_20_47_16]|nr:MAG: 6-phosphogluconate dehydrogenase [Deltaproteobacteria bacterium CG11_big_fil_rev_8_21_14_0_20_47_16]